MSDLLLVYNSLFEKIESQKKNKNLFQYNINSIWSTIFPFNDADTKQKTLTIHAIGSDGKHK